MGCAKITLVDLVDIELDEEAIFYVRSDDGEKCQCICDCGKVFMIKRRLLLRKHDPRLSCGCLVRTKAKERRTHNSSNRPWYNSYRQMKNRITNPNNADYPSFGGKGIKLCPEWMTYEGFLQDMGERPAGARLRRRDSSADFMPSNCYWRLPDGSEVIPAQMAAAIVSTGIPSTYPLRKGTLLNP
jgi:hypothetical protein